ncbi:DNA topoisomerase (ATP-hydrolyzing) subunit A [Altericista sp. CCNU0014]|uniref:DNA gyrase/topoisomerase IV subunit A n=1 Tax=Altericista sp. CCNU0014 TaxID=3082949 RepID=UPI00384E54DB
MAKQLNLLSTGKVIATALHTEMEQSYLEYAMSVIVGRALPDVRDGLKPVHRRILYAMHELGLTPDRPYRKCARVVGDVLGKYHPHGDQAVYDALVRLVQSFSSRYPLLDGHGNFGSVDNDPPAAMRYTETRLAGVANQTLLEEIGESTVDFIGNFDNSQQEPTVLPAQLPILLLNGCSGIAVGMATNIPPHNLGEVVDALIALIDRPHMEAEDLRTFIPGPDFPTGGEIIGTEGIAEAYATGRGSITVRGIAQFEESQPGKGRHRRTAIVITELPFQVNKAGLIEKTATLINAGKIEGIADLRDESDRDGMRVVIELKREAQPEQVLEQLYRQTALQSNFGVITLAIVNGQPRQLPLKELLQEFLRFREDTLIRRYRHDLDRAQGRIDIVEGLLRALENLDALVDILRHAPDGSAAKQTLQERFSLDDRQSDAILGMPMRRLTGLEQQNLRSEFEELTQQIRQLNQLLGDRKELLKTLKQDLRALKRKYGDARRTRIETAVPEKLVPLSPPEENEPVQVELSQRGYIRWIGSSSRARRRETLERSEQLQEVSQDLPLYTGKALLSEQLLVFTASGKAYAVNLADIPGSSGRDRGTPLVTLLSDSAHGEEVVAQFLPSDYADADRFVFLTRQGRFKWLAKADFTELTARGLSAIKLKDDDQLQFAIPATADMEVAIATSTGRLARFPLLEVPEMGRPALGNQVLRLLRQEVLVGLAAVSDRTDILLLSRQGYAKRLPIGSARLGHPGGLGTPLVQFAKKTDALIAMIALQPEGDLLVTTDRDRMAVVVPQSLPLATKEGAGTLWLKLKAGEQLVSAFPL